MSIKQVRNENFQPFIEDEGFFVSPSQHERREQVSGEKFEVHERLNNHNTLSSARRHAGFINTR
jgi:hypothetical protein